MTEPDPYVGEPVEPPPVPRLARLRPLLATLTVLLLVAAVVYLLLGDRPEQDPAVGSGSGQGQQELHGGALALTAPWR